MTPPRIIPLDPLAFPLTGSHLIEASAGTGKTFTIAMLYVRLILGHRGDLAFSGGPLTPPDILVVTFTEAATQELRDRIRARLTEAAQCFRQAPDSPDTGSGDDLLRTLRASYPVAEWPLCARKLEVAAEWMDEAAVSTIHGWCNRMLREHAFDSQSLFTQNLETDPSALRAEVVRDYWRIFFYPLDLEAMRQVKCYWEHPEALEAAVTPLLAHAGQLASTADPAALISRCQSTRDTQLQALKQPWRAWADEIRDLLDEGRRLGQAKGRMLRQDWYGSWLDSLKHWAEDPEQDSLDLKKGWERLTPEGIAEAWQGGPPPEHPGFAHIATLQAALAALPDPRNELLCHAARWVAREFAAARRRRAQIGFDDLLTGLDAALQGPQGPRLAEIIRRQFPVALIDEFQDTDPVQYRIFERIYELQANRPDCALILIGDPKQAIYAFRGADIHTYLRARRAVGDRLYTLETNFRSTAAMVEASNHCFAQAEARPGSSGAFLFAREQDNPVPFLQVKARGRADEFRIDGQAVPAMLLAVLGEDKALSKSDYLARMSEICASQIVDWLNRGSIDRAGFAHRDGDFRPLQPGDIAILVNNGKEADSIRQALARRQLRSVYLSDKETVYATPQALEVRRWLAACAEPDNDRLLRGALATPSLGLSLAELDTLNVDEEAWEARVLQFKGYRELWQRQGVLPMLRRILIDFACSERLLAQAAGPDGQSGERILTDILHLAEILQQKSFTLEGEHALIRFLSEQIKAPGGEGDGRKLRLESDEDLLKVVTIHKSKGLEYPLVFLPFIAATRLTRDSDVPLKWHDEAGELQIGLEARPEHLEQADRERLAEDLRKLYVALTRARHLTWLGLAPIGRNEPNAIGHLFGVSGLDGTAYASAIRAFIQGQPSLQLIEELPLAAHPFTPRDGQRPPGSARRPQRPAREAWWISSYSALRASREADGLSGPIDESPLTENLLEGQREILSAPVAPPRPGSAIHRFFRGAEAGTFLHELMEWGARTGFRTCLEAPDALRDMIARRCQVRGWEAWVDPLFNWVRQMLTTPLPAGGIDLRLDALSRARPEMEFWFEASQVDLTQLDALVTRHTLQARPRPGLDPGQLNGMLKGFIDLVFEHEGRYYVADYKSNWLGASDEAYTPEALEQAIREHRYDLQYVLYLFALHRLLRSRRTDYDYDRDIGGALYLFMRGIAAPGAGVHFERPARALIEALDDLFDGQPGEAA